jgi:hypothetical protein
MLKLAPNLYYLCLSDVTLVIFVKIPYSTCIGVVIAFWQKGILDGLKASKGSHKPKLVR